MANYIIQIQCMFWPIYLSFPKLNSDDCWSHFGRIPSLNHLATSWQRFFFCISCRERVHIHLWNKIIQQFIRFIQNSGPLNPQFPKKNIISNKIMDFQTSGGPKKDIISTCFQNIWASRILRHTQGVIKYET